MGEKSGREVNDEAKLLLNLSGSNSEFTYQTVTRQLPFAIIIHWYSDWLYLLQWMTIINLHAQVQCTVCLWLNLVLLARETSNFHNKVKSWKRGLTSTAITGGLIWPPITTFKLLYLYKIKRNLIVFKMVMFHFTLPRFKMQK